MTHHDEGVLPYISIVEGSHALESHVSQPTDLPLTEHTAKRRIDWRRIHEPYYNKGSLTWNQTLTVKAPDVA